MNPLTWPAETREYLAGVQIEFKKVTWPTQKETIAATVGTCIVVLVICIALFGVDNVVGWLMRAFEGLLRESLG